MPKASPFVSVSGSDVLSQGVMIVSVVGAMVAPPPPLMPASKLFALSSV